MTKEAHFFIGLEAPTHFLMGQIEQESACKSGVTAFDGGMGLAQFMPDKVGWYFTFRAYNGGLGILNKEIAKADSCEESIIEKTCKRKTVMLPSGKPLDMCANNIKYPYAIFKRAEKYKI